MTTLGITRFDFSRALRQIGLGTRQRLVRYANGAASLLSPTFDVGKTDYNFWARARKGTARGIEISALLLRPLESKIASWSLGSLPTIVMKNKASSEFIEKWLKDHHKDLLMNYQQSLGLGDSFILVNPDLSTIVFSPDIVVPIVDDKDYTHQLGWRVTQVIPHPSKANAKMEIINSFTNTKRTKEIWVTDSGPRTRTFYKSYNNLIKRCPLVHVPNDPEAWEMFGHAEGEALVPLLQRYNEILIAAMEGNMRQGRPTPVVEKLGTTQEVNQFWKQYGRSVVTDLGDGITETTEEIDFDADKLLTLGGDATFKWEAPGSFAGDTEKLLGLLFYLYLQHSELPEAILGNAVQTGTDFSGQLEPLIKFIEKKQTLIEPWFKEICEIALAWNGLVEVKADQKKGDEVEIHWPKLTGSDEQLSLNTVQWLYMQGLIDRKTAVSLVPVDIANPDQAIADAEKDYPNRPVQGYPTSGGSGAGGDQKTGTGGKPTPAQKQPTDKSDRDARSNGKSPNGGTRNKRSDSKSTNPEANRQKQR